MTEPRYVEHQRAGAVDTVTIHRPEVHNAFNEHVIAQIAEAFATIAASGDTRVVVLRGEGRSFSAGADLDWMRRAANFTDEENRRDADALASMLRAVAECPCPVVARVQGNAFGGGAGLAAAADIAVAGESARFAFSEVRLGLVPATIARHVVRKIGAGRALPLFLTGERIDAARALGDRPRAPRRDGGPARRRGRGDGRCAARGQPGGAAAGARNWCATSRPTTSSSTATPPR